MATSTPQRHYWIFSADPHHYHWDTLFVKGKEMWHGAEAKPDALRALKQVRKGDRVLCYHSAPERSLYSIAEVTRDPYPDPHDYKGKNLVADLRAFEKLPRQVRQRDLRANRALRKVKFLKNVRLIISPLGDAEYQEILKMAGKIGRASCREREEVYEVVVKMKEKKARAKCRESEYKVDMCKA